MSVHDVLLNPDLLNIVLLMLGPHAMQGVRAFADCKTAVKDTEWFGYFDLLRRTSLSNILHWHVQRFGPRYYAAVWNGKTIHKHPFIPRSQRPPKWRRLSLETTDDRKIVLPRHVFERLFDQVEQALDGKHVDFIQQPSAECVCVLQLDDGDVVIPFYQRE